MSRGMDALETKPVGTEGRGSAVHNAKEKRVGKIVSRSRDC